MKINKETQALNDTLNTMDLIDIYNNNKTEFCILLFQKQQNTLSSQVLMEHSPG